MSDDKFAKELEFIKKMNNDYIFRNNEDALDRALNRESLFIEDGCKNIKAKILIEDGLMEIKNSLINFDAFSESEIVDNVINGFYPLKIDFYYDDEREHQNLGLFDISDSDCQFSVYPRDGLVKFTIQVDLLLPFKYPVSSMAINKINFKLVSEIGVITDLNFSIDLIEL
jgi:hypothetical protein